MARRHRGGFEGASSAASLRREPLLGLQFPELTSNQLMDPIVAQAANIRADLAQRFGDVEQRRGGDDFALLVSLSCPGPLISRNFSKADSCTHDASPPFRTRKPRMGNS